MRKFLTETAVILCLLLTSCRHQDDGMERVYTEALAEGSLEEEAAAVMHEEDGEEWQDRQEKSVYVHVCGAVETPGVYTFVQGQRCCDAVEAAGGLLEDADPDRINLALMLMDGQKLYIPFQGEALSSAGQEYDNGAVSGLVNINTADAKLLMTLPGIGSTRAESILAYRNAHGGFRSTEELMQVDGIKEKLYEKLKDLVVVN